MITEDECFEIDDVRSMTGRRCFFKVWNENGEQWGVWGSREILRALTVDNGRGLFLTMFHGFPLEDEIKDIDQSDIRRAIPLYRLVHFKRWTRNKVGHRFSSALVWSNRWRKQSQRNNRRTTTTDSRFTTRFFKQHHVEASSNQLYGPDALHAVESLQGVRVHCRQWLRRVDDSHPVFPSPVPHLDTLIAVDELSRPSTYSKLLDITSYSRFGTSPDDPNE